LITAIGIMVLVTHDDIAGLLAAEDIIEAWGSAVRTGQGPGTGSAAHHEPAYCRAFMQRSKVLRHSG